jgi:hypothetical protein
MNGTFQNKLLFLQGLFLFLLTLAPFASQYQTPIEVLKVFVADINKQNYRKAYLLFSLPLMQKVGYADFREGAKRVKWAKLLSARLISKTTTMAKARVLLEDLEKDPEETQWRKRRYSGIVVMLREKGHWRFIQIIIDKRRKKHGIRSQ